MLGLSCSQCLHHLHKLLCNSLDNDVARLLRKPCVLYSSPAPKLHQFGLSSTSWVLTTRLRYHERSLKNHKVKWPLRHSTQRIGTLFSWSLMSVRFNEIKQKHLIIASFTQTTKPQISSYVYIYIYIVYRILRCSKHSSGWWINSHPFSTFNALQSLTIKWLWSNASLVFRRSRRLQDLLPTFSPHPVSSL